MTTGTKHTGIGPSPVRTDYQRLEDLACAHWLSEVFFSALELDIFELLGHMDSSVDELAARTGWDRDALERLLNVLTGMELVVEFDGRYANSTLAARYLLAASSEYLGDFLAYRRYIAPHWARLPDRIRQGTMANDRPLDEPDADYQARVLAYVRALDGQARLKAREAAPYLFEIMAQPPQRILDLGGGAGSWGRVLRNNWPEARVTLLDLPDVLTAASRLFPNYQDWQGVDRLAANGLSACLKAKSYDLIVLSNILHAYGLEELPGLLENAARLLSPKGTVVIHDYLTGDAGARPLKGRLYDLHMMLNTYNGRIFGIDVLSDHLAAAGLTLQRTIHLKTDSSLLLAGKTESAHQTLTDVDLLAMQARRLGFDRAKPISTEDIPVYPWVRFKCAHGCSGYNANWQCPPHSPDENKTRDMLACYGRAILVQGTPPGRDFHDKLLELERLCFLEGYPKALAFGAGPCPVCKNCDTGHPCRFPDKARPSLEACGVDVYETARRAGWDLEPVKDRMDGVKYIGAVLLD